jgi:hypothetical protein
LTYPYALLGVAQGLKSEKWVVEYMEAHSKYCKDIAASIGADIAIGITNTYFKDQHDTAAFILRSWRSLSQESS